MTLATSAGIMFFLTFYLLLSIQVLVTDTWRAFTEMRRGVAEAFGADQHIYPDFQKP